MRALYRVLALVLVTAGAPACKKIAGMATDAVQGSSNDPAKSSTAVEAMGHYATGFNALIGDPQDMIKNYYREFPESGPVEGKKHHLFPKHTSAEGKIAEAKKEFAAAAKIAPDSLKHLEPLASATVTDIEKVAVTYKSVHGYFQAEDFKDDKGAKGKTLHTQFLQEAAAFREDIDKFETALSEIALKQAEEELKEHTDKNTYSYQFRYFNHQANELVSVKRDGFLALYPTVETAYNELQAFTKGKGTPQATFKAYADAADRFFAEAKKLKRGIEGKEKEEQLDSISESMTSNYNNLVSLSNSLRSLEANNLLK
ncbi:DUF3829 domain-containing protein [Sorangium sp. So ce302]|uniref:DUF3829 domain-containing protein n=1 Tax=Sorangium sp. So ce302 TaxID=3133297 RepID=UPI003F60C036